MFILSYPFLEYSSYLLKKCSPENHPSFFFLQGLLHGPASWKSHCQHWWWSFVPISIEHPGQRSWDGGHLDCSGWMFLAQSLRFLTHPPPSDGNTHQTFLCDLVTPRNFGPHQKGVKTWHPMHDIWRIFLGMCKILWINCLISNV